MYVSKYRHETGCYQITADVMLEDMQYICKIYGSVANNNRLWIGLLHLLTASCNFTRNHNELQEFTINLQPNPSSLPAEDSLQYLSR
jgi:hypothetical protein